MCYKLRIMGWIMLAVITCGVACKPAANKKAGRVIYKGLYSFGPELKTFKPCDDSPEYWVTDSSARLELQYSEMNFEKPYEPVYIEVEGKTIPSAADGAGAEFDSTLVVKKVLKITKEIPEELCN
jgi:copper homeostasis protein (lipoprotein)